jgi:DNA-binding MarR family transcriptional regulator
MTRPEEATPGAGQPPVPGAAFLLSQLGYHSSTLWQRRLAPLDLDPRHVMLLRHLAGAEGRSQQALGEALRIPASRMVAIVDGLEQRGLLRRRPNPDDRRVRTLHLTDDGRRLLREIGEISREHERQLTTGLARAEREQLIALLSRLAAEQGLAEGVHPGAADPPSEERQRRPGTTRPDS